MAKPSSTTVWAGKWHVIIVSSSRLQKKQVTIIYCMLHNENSQITVHHQQDSIVLLCVSSG